MFKFVSGAGIPRLLHVRVHQVSNMTVPICITCCIAVILCCSIKNFLAVERQIMPISSCCSNNFGNRLLYLSIDFIRGNINGNGRIDALQRGHDFISKFYTGISESLLSIITIGNVTTEGGEQKPDSKRIKISDNKFDHDDDLYLCYRKEYLEYKKPFG